jgi:dienelactone hydrolase
LFALIAAVIIDGSSPAPSASPSAQPMVPNGTYTYAFRQGSTALGTAIIAVQRANGAVKTHEIDAVAGRSFTVDQTLDPVTFIPQTLDAIYPGAAPTAIHVTFGATAFDESIHGLGSKSLTPTAGAKGIVVLDNVVLSGFFLTPAQSKANGSTSLTGLSPGSETIFPLALVPAAAASRPASVPAADVGSTVTGLQSGEITVWSDPQTFVPADFEIPAQSLSIVLVKESASAAMSASAPPSPKPLPTATPHFTSRDVTFRSSDGTLLSGTLTVPERPAARLPAVVLVHGSGATNRDEQIGPNPIFLELSNALSNHGYVVLRYDKRGVGKSGGDARTFTRDQLLADARAAIGRVAREPHVDAHAIFVVGHSEGGELAPSLAAGGAPLRGIALMAPPAIPLDQILLQQSQLGLQGAAAKQARTREEHAILGIKTGVANGSGAAWLRSSFGIDPAEVIKHVPCPILVLQGGKDFQVLASDLPRLVDAARAAHRQITVRLFPDDDHLFITHPVGQAATMADYMLPHRVDPAMIAALLDWLDARAR